MSAMDLEAPSPLVSFGDDSYTVVQYNPVYDAGTIALTDSLNAVTPFPPTMPIVFNTWVRSYGPGIGDSQYNVGFHQADVPQSVIITGNYEAPDVPVTHLPFASQLYNSTLTQQQAGDIIFNSLRAPTINEGLF